MRRLLPLALCAVSSLVSAQPPPTIAGLPLWSGDLRSAPSPVRDAIATWQAAHRPLPAPRGRSLDATNAWAQEVYQPWLRRQAAALDAAEAALTVADAPASWRLLAAVVVGDVVEHVVTRLFDLPSPTEIASDPQLVATYEEAMREGVRTPLRERALPAYERCVALAGTGPWAAHCAARANALRREWSLASTPVAPTRPAPPTAEVRGATSTPAVCASAEPLVADDTVTPLPDTPSVLALDYRGPLDARNAERLLTAVERALARRGLRALPREEVRAARALVRARQLRPDGPVCQVGPSLAMLLAPTHPNVVVATVVDECHQDRCELTVAFHRPRRGGEAPGEVPDGLSAPIDRRRRGVRDLVAAAARLEPGHPPLYGVLRARPELAVAHTVPNDSVFSVADRLRARNWSFRECFAGTGTVAFHVRAQLDETGHVTSSEVQTLEATGPEPALAALRACVQRVVAATPFPCPPEGVRTVEADVCFPAARGDAR